MNCGVSKSGSPAPIAITSRPSALSFAALAVTARVGEGLMAFRRWAMSIGMTAPGICSTWIRLILLGKIIGFPDFLARRIHASRHVSVEPVPPAPAVRAGGRPAAGDREAHRGPRRRALLPNAPRRHRVGKDVHHGERHRAHGTAGAGDRAQPDPRRA